jgi:1A family penicillin-binding protein
MPFGRKSSRFSRQRYTSFPKSPRSKRKAIKKNITRPVTNSFTKKTSKKLTIAGFKLPKISFGKIKLFIINLFTTKEGWKKLGFVAFLGFVMIAALFFWYAKDLPSPDKINARMNAQSTQIFDRNGKLLYEIHGDQNRILADWNEIPTNVKNATIAIEDKNFYKHGGFSITGIARAFFGVVTGNRAQGGGSTITQQYVKNTLLTNEYSFTRKIKEVILAIEIERRYKKDDILKMYLNEIPYGSNAYGIKVAAKTYFNKELKDLTLEEAATLVAMPQAPTYYSPYGTHKDELMSRKDKILDLMAEQKYITNEERDAAKKIEISFSNNPYGSITAPHFVMYVKEQLVAKYGETTVNSGGLKVYTTLDVEKQKYAEEAVATNVDKNKSRYNASNAGLVAMDPKTGQILAMVGSRDYFDENIDGNVNVTLAERQPGSSFKPFAYATLFKEENWGAGSFIYDLKTDFGGGYIPQNYSGGFWGPVTIRTALQNSLNIPAVKTLYMAGLEDTLSTAHAMGITTLNDPSQYGLSIVLGAGEVKLLDMTNAYGVFANDGVKQDPTWMVRIEDNKGKVIDEYKANSGKRVLDSQVTYLLNNILSDDQSRAQTFGAGSALTLSGRSVAAKTGTTNSYKDAWTMGYTPSLVAGVWSGNNDGTPMSSGGGAFAAAPIWHDFMTKALAGSTAEQFKKPSGIKTVTVSGGNKSSTDIYPSWYKPNAAAGNSQTINIYTPDGKLATDKCPAELVETKTYTSIVAEIPSTDSAYSSWFAPIAAWAADQGLSTDTGAIPTQTTDQCSGADVPTISIISPNGNGNIVGPKVDVVLEMVVPAVVMETSVTLVGNKTFTATLVSSSGNTYYYRFTDVTAGEYNLSATVKDKKYQTATSKIIKITVK